MINGGQLRSAARTKRWLAVSIALLVLSVGYLFLLRNFNVPVLPGERHFGATGAVKPAAEVYIEPISIDAFNDAMQVRAYLEPSVSSSGEHFAAADRELTLLITHDRTVEEIRLAGNDHLASALFEVDLSEGSVAHYPLDSYRVKLGVQVFEGKTAAVKLPARVTVWEGVLGYELHSTGQSGADPERIQLKLDIVRSGAFALFALAAYGAMVVLGGCALAIGILTFVDVEEAGGNADRCAGGDRIRIAGVTQRITGLATTRYTSGHVCLSVDRACGRDFARPPRLQVGAKRPAALKHSGCIIPGPIKPREMVEEGVYSGLRMLDLSQGVAAPLLRNAAGQEQT